MTPVGGPECPRHDGGETHPSGDSAAHAEMIGGLAIPLECPEPGDAEKAIDLVGWRPSGGGARAASDGWGSCRRRTTPSRADRRSPFPDLPRPDALTSPKRPTTVDMVDQPTARRLVTDARFGVLATVTTEGHPHVVPCCFVLHGDVIYSAVDAKPKSTLALRRLDNLRADPAAALLVHHDDEDWSTLWWVRVDGRGSVLEAEHTRAQALHLLAAKYPQYRSTPPPGDVILLEIEGWRWWP